MLCPEYPTRAREALCPARLGGGVAKCGSGSAPAPCRDSVGGMTEQRTPRESQAHTRAANWRTFGPEVMATRRAVRMALRPVSELHRQVGEGEVAAPLMLVALSGGADSLALALAVAYEAPKCAVRAGAIIVDHGLQAGSAEVAARAAEQARQMGLHPVLVESVRVPQAAAGGGPEAVARQARYAAFSKAASETAAWGVLTAHTHDDQAEQVLLALARGSGLRSLAGIPAERALGAPSAEDGAEDATAGGRVLLRPFLGTGKEAGSPSITRATTEAACADQGVSFWRDPHNLDSSYARVRVRQRVLPMLESELGPGVADALVRTADLAREDADALDEIARVYAMELLGGRGDACNFEGDATGVRPEELAPEALAPEALAPGAARLVVSVVDLAALSKPVLYRVIRVIAQLKFGAYLERVHTLAIAALVLSWNGQREVYVPGIFVTRRAGQLSFERQTGSPRA